MIIQILLAVIAVLQVAYSFRFKGIFHKVIAFGQLLVILLAYLLYVFQHSLLVVTAILFLLATLTLIYGSSEKGVNKITRITLIITGGAIMLMVLFKIMHWPNIINLCLGLVSVVLFIVALVKERKLIKELSFMPFWLIYSILFMLNIVF